MPINSIHWFPGHMAKALREVEAKVKYIDVIIELLDARAPNSSLNPYLNKISPQKPRLIILAKKDLADEKKAQKWL
ncbi:MAG: ribosome biogenesis GTPase YlqF, partial [Bacilli bacterium]